MTSVLSASTHPEIVLEGEQRNGKVCGRCRQAKPYGEFYKNSRNKRDGRQDWCKTCMREYDADKHVKMRDGDGIDYSHPDWARALREQRERMQAQHQQKERDAMSTRDKALRQAAEEANRNASHLIAVTQIPTLTETPKVSSTTATTPQQNVHQTVETGKEHAAATTSIKTWLTDGTPGSLFVSGPFALEKYEHGIAIKTSDPSLKVPNESISATWLAFVMRALMGTPADQDIYGTVFA